MRRCKERPENSEYGFSSAAFFGYFVPPACGAGIMKLCRTMGKIRPDRREKKMEQFLKIGVITSTHGIRGEVKVFPTTDDPERFGRLKEVYLRGGKEQLELKVQGVKYFKQMVILKFLEFDSINEVEKYRGCELYVSREQAVPLEENEYYIADLLGMSVYTEAGELLGNLRDVIETGANDVYCVNTEKYGEVLIPAIRQCILQVDVEAGRMTVHLLPGLLPDFQKK